MFSLQAKSLTISGIDGLAAPGRWVDFGLRSLSAGLHIPEQGGEDGGGEGGAEPELEIVEFPYGGRVGGWLDELGMAALC